MSRTPLRPRLVAPVLMTLFLSLTAHADMNCPTQSTASATKQAETLVKALREELRPVERQILQTPFLLQIERGDLDCDRVAALAAEEYTIVASDLKSFQHMAQRWPFSSPESASTLGFFESLAATEASAMPTLLRFAESMGLNQSQLYKYEVRPMSQVYPARVAALALHSDRASAAAALLLNFPVFGEAMGIVRDALLTHYGFRADQIEFISAFANPLPPEFEASAIEEIARGLEQGACPDQIRRATRLVQHAELAFWQAASNQPGSPLPECSFPTDSH